METQNIYTEVVTKYKWFLHGIVHFIQLVFAWNRALYSAQVNYSLIPDDGFPCF